MIAMKEHDGTCREDEKAVEEARWRETTGTPLCCTRWRQKSKDLQAEWMFSFFNLCLVCWRVGIITKSNFFFFFPQCLKAFMRLRNKKVTEKRMRTAVGLYMQSRCLSGVIWWIFALASSALLFILVLMSSDICIAWLHVAWGSQELWIAACWGLEVFLFFFFKFTCDRSTGFRWKRLPGSAKGYIVGIDGERCSVTTDRW